MKIARRAGWIGLGTGFAALVIGLALTVGSAIAAGDWWLAREPWIGDGLNLSVIGLAVTAVFALWLNVVEPLGWLRLLAVPPALVVGLFWWVLLVVGVGTSGFGGPAHDPATILYSLPDLLVIVLLATVLMALPLALTLLSRLHQVGSARNLANRHSQALRRSPP